MPACIKAGILLFMSDIKEILILGAGVSGLSTGILLLKRGYIVTIWAKDLPPNTTSDKAAAYWFPYLCNPKDKCTIWGKVTFDYFLKEFVNDPKSGCFKRKGIELFTEKKSDPWWKDAVPEFKRSSSEDLPSGYIDGYEFDGIIMDTSIYMDYLVNLFNDLGGKIIQKSLSNKQEALHNHDVVVNCTGLGSRELFNDETIYPVRGQTVKVKPNGFDKVLADAEGPNNLAYIIPRTNDIVLGGTDQVNDWNLEVNPGDTKGILERVANLSPQFKTVEVIGESVGLRPTREVIRVEAEKFGNKTVVHNYGHGGSGFTLSWGCAQDVVEIVEGL